MLKVFLAEPSVRPIIPLSSEKDVQFGGVSVMQQSSSTAPSKVGGDEKHTLGTQSDLGLIPPKEKKRKTFESPIKFKVQSVGPSLCPADDIKIECFEN